MTRPRSAAPPDQRDPRAQQRSGRRWLVKALYEAAGELRELLMTALVDDHPEAETLIDRVWRDETIAGWQIAHLLFRDDPDLPLHDLEWLQPEPPATYDAFEQLREFSHTREQICGVLSMIDDHDWDQAANHRFRGPINPETVARDIQQRDLEILIALRRNQAATP